ncbi:MAG TPA: trypsin-like peptidase domain-containing protein [Stackebrandtia sp.]|jgi:S1-C subfamily serine protease|uniref:S1C family serine protease n=1 Tax=Stackebrandtia sp. TaxID=2023065 RepID=UPI002D3164EA|nr:trypsin-like peptidase domain-containing protein [Stackebrandtia sp.]HZE37409.1 trypsin-like peptidase domain-containing protein [Stackebrandtia sp.]
MRRGWIGLVLLAGLATSVTGCQSPGGGSSDSSQTGTGSSLEDDYQSTVKSVLPSIVQINTADGLGSGVVYDDDGHIVTNAHVVGDATSFQVTPAAGGDSVRASLVAAYPPDDLAVIKVDSTSDFAVDPAVFADSGDVRVGDMVLAMGNPLGLTGSVSEGIVSSVGRTVSEPGSKETDATTIADMIQTTASINPGNSGGALVNLSNKVVGIPTLGAVNPDLGNSAAPGIGFAISANTATRIVDQIVDSGKVTDSDRATLGIQTRQMVDADLNPAGIGVVKVDKGGSGDEAGIEAGDVIVQLGDTGVDSISQLNDYLASKRPGQKVTVTVQRGDAEKRLKATLDERR